MQRLSNYRIILLLETILRNQEIIMSGLDDLKAAVANETSVEASAVTLIQGLADQVRNAGSDADLKALADQITQATQPLANAVMANTTAAGSGAGAAGSGSTGGSAGRSPPATPDAGAKAPVTAADAGSTAQTSGTTAGS